MQYVPRWALIAFVALMALSAAVALAAPTSLPFAQTGVGVDPLSEDESERALDAVQSQLGVQAASVRTAPSATTGQAAIEAPGEETLLVERHPEEKVAMASGNWARRADVYIYRYADDHLIHGIYDYTTGATTTLEEVQGVQLPLSESERSLAARVAFADPATLEYMQGEYHRITGSDLVEPGQVDIRAFVYHAGADPETEPPEASVCGIERCAQLMILADDNVTFDVMPIVNLSRLTVASLTPVVISPADAAAANAADARHESHEESGGGHE